MFAVGGNRYREIVGMMRAQETASLGRAADGVARDGLAVETVLLEGDVVAELVRQSGSLDLLALGSRGYGAARRVAAGAVSIGVLRDAACPVLVLPRGVADPFAGEAADGDRDGADLAVAGASADRGGERR
jgi:nucleotide-binding universal stress UspA family protein